MDILNELATLANALTEADLALEAAENAYKAAKEHARVLREETIPAAMQEAGVQSFTLGDGRKISIKLDVYASIPPDQKHAAFEWLSQNGFGGLIKTAVSVDFAKGELDKANNFYQDLLAHGYNAKNDRSVHQQTLKAFLREQMAEGRAVPLELFGASPKWVTKITAGR